MLLSLPGPPAYGPEIWFYLIAQNSKARNALTQTRCRNGDTSEIVTFPFRDERKGLGYLPVRASVGHVSRGYELDCFNVLTFGTMDQWCDVVLDAQSPNPAALMQARIYIGEDDILIFRDESPRHTSYMMREGSASELYDYERELGQNMEQVVSETLRQRVLIEAYPTMISLAGARFTISFVRPGEPIDNWWLQKQKQKSGFRARIMEGLSSVKVDEDDPETGWRAWVGPLHRELAEEERIRPYHHKLKHFGKGGFAEVDLVVHLRSGRLTAVKTMDVRKNHDLAQLAYKEADNIAKFITSHNEHDNIVDFYGMDRLEQEGQLRIYMSPANSNLRDLMEPFGQVKQALDAQTLQAVTDQILQALIYLHGVIGLIHRDVKPDNILVKNLSEGHPDVIVFQLADFGLSKEVRRAGKTECGTYLYWAPEVMQLAYANERIENDLFRSPDEPKDNHRPRTQTPTMDVWAFGVTLLEAALSGPFCGYLDLRSTALVRRWPSLLRQRSRGTPVEHIFVDNPGKRPRADQLVGTIVWENLTSIIRGRLDTQTVSDHVTGKIGSEAGTFADLVPMSTTYNSRASAKRSRADSNDIRPSKYSRRSYYQTAQGDIVMP